MRRQQAHSIKLRSQSGVALIIMLVIVVLGATTILVSALNRSSLKTQQDQDSNQVLAHSREAVMGYVLNGSGGGQRPGDMPYPDRLIEPTPNYDGNTDSCPTLQSYPTATGCLGRFPWQTLGLSISSPSEHDPSGTMPWYAVSANLVDPVNVIFNPDLLNSNPVHSWLTVRDMNGNVLSNRVAIVLTLPGPPLSGQNRLTSPNLGGPNQYLDSITVPNDCTSPCVPGTYSNYDLDDSFIMGEEKRWITDPSNSANKIEDSSYQFNDKLTYITIDDLMPEIIQRAAGEARSVLNKFYSAKNKFPGAALLGSSGTYSQVSANDSGMLPIDLGTCSCTSSTNCSCNFDLITSAAFQRSSSSWSATNVSGACTRTTTQTCTCTGAGYCRNSTGSRNFTCNSAGNCTHNTTGTYIFTPPTYGTLSSATNNCSLSSSNIRCTGSGSFTSKLTFPSWFTDNLWQDFFYYHRSTTASLQSGTQGSIQALLIGTSAPIISAPFASKGSAQVRPSSNINDYLDSAENADSDLQFEATNKQLSSSYNDQVLIVAP